MRLQYTWQNSTLILKTMHIKMYGCDFHVSVAINLCMYKFLGDFPMELR